MTNSNGADKQSSGLRKELGLTAALMIVVGRIIGSGIFRTPGAILIAVSGLVVSEDYSSGRFDEGQVTIGLFFVAWILGGVATFLAAFCFAELVAMLPKSGGPYAYLRAAYGDLFSFLRGWAMFFVSETASIVAVALVFSEYTSIAMSGDGLDLFQKSLLALFVIWAMTVANMFGVFASGVLQDILGFIKIGALLLIVVLSFASGGEASHFSSHLWPESWGWGTILAINTAMRYAFFAYSGWEGSTYVAEEVKNPSRNLPLALFLGIGGVMLVYLLVNVAYVYQVSGPDIVRAGRGIAGEAMRRAAGPAGAILLAVLVMISTFGNVNTQIMVKARTWHAMARDGLFFSTLAKTSKRFGTPNRALALQGGWASVLLGLATLDAWANEKAAIYETIIDFFSFTSGIFNVATIGAVIVLRKKMPDLARPFRVPYFWFTVTLTLALYGFYTIGTLIEDPLSSLAGLALTLTGFVYYFAVVRPRVNTR